MRDISDKRESLRRARARARVEMSPEIAQRVAAGTVPKGSVVDITRAAAMLGVKQTPELLPFCHRIPLDYCDARVEAGEGEVTIEVEVAAIARTGVEVEAMTGASIAALNVYDMVKPLDAGARIASVELIEKRGGKSSWVEKFDRPLSGGVIVVSDSVAAGTAEDRAGKAVQAALDAHGLQTRAIEVVPDEPEALSRAVCALVDDEGCDLVCAVGGTGLGPRDQTPETLRPLFEREIPGVAEAIRDYGRLRTPLADLSRCVAGQRGRSVIVGTPGSTGGAREAMQAILPWVLHLFKVFDRSFRHGA